MAEDTQLMCAESGALTLAYCTRRHWLIATTAFATGCTGQASPRDAAALVDLSKAFIGPRAGREGFQTLRTIAECVGPQGRFQTEIRSSASGAVTMIQRFPDGPPFIAGVNADGAWMLDGDETAAADSTMAAVILTHQFHLMALRLDDVFEIQSVTGRETFQGHDCWRVEMRFDNLSAAAFIDANDHRLRGVRMDRPGGAPGDPIEWTYTDWTTLQGNRLPAGVRILDNQDIYTYRFTRIAFDTLDPGEVGQPDSAASTR